MIPPCDGKSCWTCAHSYDRPDAEDAEKRNDLFIRCKIESPDSNTHHLNYSCNQWEDNANTVFLLDDRVNPQNALIKSYSLHESHSWSQCLELILELTLEKGGVVCFECHGVYSEKHTKNELAYAIKKVMDIVGVERLEDITGKPIRAIFAGEGSFGSNIIGIGHFLEDKWFVPSIEKMWRGFYTIPESPQVSRGVTGGIAHIQASCR